MTAPILLALLLGGVTGAVAGYLGSLMLTKRMALMGGALGHLTMPGVALALLYDFDVSLGALLFLGIGVLLIWYLEQKTKLHLEALTAVVFSTSLSIAFLFLPEEETEIALLGDVSRITLVTVVVTASIAAALWLTIKKIYANMVLLGISADLARTQGVDMKRCNLIYLVCIALAVALGVRIVGGLMTAALLAIPACTAKNLSHDLAHYAQLSSLAGGLSCVVGIGLYAATDIPAGPLIIIVSAAFFVYSIFAKPSSN